MVRVIDSAIVSAYTADPYRQTVFHLCELVGGAQTYRFTDAPVPVVWGGFTWTNVDFQVSELVQDLDGELSGSLTFEDVSRTIRSLAFNEDLQERVIKVYEVWANASNTVFGQDLILHGLTDGVRCSGEDGDAPTAVMALRSLFAASAAGIGPLQNYERNCRYQQFKGPQCKYAGAVTFCNRLFSTCDTLGNTINFGGFRFALDAGQSITWGAVAGRLGSRDVPPPAPPPEPTGGVVPTTPTPTTRQRAARRV